MRHSKVKFSISPTACIGFALAVILLPLNVLTAWFIAVSIHEISHVLAAKICKAEIHSVNFRLFGATISTEALSVWQQIFCAVSGPTGGLLLTFTVSRFPLLAICGGIQSFFNLLPFKRSDGGTVLRCILLLCLEEDRAYSVCEAVDRILRFILYVGGLFIAWKLSWFTLAVFSTIALLCRSYVKTPCKQVL